MIKLNALINGQPAEISIPAEQLIAVLMDMPRHLRSVEVQSLIGRLTREDMAVYFQVSPRTIDNWKAQNVIPFFKIGDAVRFDLFDVLAHLKKKHHFEAL